MVPSFSFLRPYAIPRHTGHGKWHGIPTKHTPPIDKPIPVWSQHIQSHSHMKGALFQTLRKCFFQKMETFSPLGNVSIGKEENPFSHL